MGVQNGNRAGDLFNIAFGIKGKADIRAGATGGSGVVGIAGALAQDIAAFGTGVAFGVGINYIQTRVAIKQCYGCLYLLSITTILHLAHAIDQ